MKKGRLRTSTVVLLILGVLALGIIIALVVVSRSDGNALRQGYDDLTLFGQGRADRFAGARFGRNPGAFGGRYMPGYRSAFAMGHGGIGSGLLALGAGLLVGTLYSRRKRQAEPIVESTIDATVKE